MRTSTWFLVIRGVIGFISSLADCIHTLLMPRRKLILDETDTTAFLIFLLFVVENVVDSIFGFSDTGILS